MTDVHHKPEYSTPAGNILTERKSCPVITIEPVWTIVTFSKKMKMWVCAQATSRLKDFL